MNKTLFKSKEDFDSFITSYTGYVQGHGIVQRWEWFTPKKYPCIAVWHIEYDGNGPDMLDGEFVYLDDFED